MKDEQAVQGELFRRGSNLELVCAIDEVFDSRSPRPISNLLINLIRTRTYLKAHP